MEENNSIRESIGLKINQLITQKKLTKSYIIDRMSIARPTLDEWIKGNVAISAESLFALADIFDVPVSYFFNEINSILPEKKKPKVFLAFEVDESQEEKVLRMVMGKDFLTMINRS